MSMMSKELMVSNPDVHLVFDLYAFMHVAMEQFHPDARDDVRRAYLVKGPTKPFGNNFPCNSFMINAIF